MTAAVTVVPSVVQILIHAYVATPAADNNILHTDWYMVTYQFFTLLLVHNYVLSVSKDHVQFFSKNLIFLIFFLLQTRHQNSALPVINQYWISEPVMDK